MVTEPDLPPVLYGRKETTRGGSYVLFGDVEIQTQELVIDIGTENIRELQALKEEPKRLNNRLIIGVINSPPFTV